MFANLLATSADPHPALVVLMGIGTVFIGLTCIILLVEVMHAVFAKCSKSKQPAQETASLPTSETVIPNREEFVAAVSAVLAEELGTDISAIRIHSIKKL